MSGSPLLKLEDVACIRGGRLLFEGVDLRIAQSEAVVVTGPNGAGKSSLIRIAAGLLPASSGVVARGGALALADEGLALDQKLTLARALRFWAKLDGAAAELGMEALGLGGLADVPVRMLSTGQRKRASLARVVASNAPLWLLDEPLNGLDSEGTERLARAVERHRDTGGAILVATHQPMPLPGASEVRLG